MRGSLNRNGFTYLTALMLVMIMGIMLGAVGQSWRTLMQREREEELLFRGRQYKNAIERWYNPGAGIQPTPLKDLKHLLQDPRSQAPRRYLRRLYTDPVTGGEWVKIEDPQKGIRGVYSSSEEKPLKVGGFPDDLRELSDKTRYSDWQFVYLPTGTSGAGGTTTGTATPSGTPVVRTP